MHLTELRPATPVVQHGLKIQISFNSTSNCTCIVSSRKTWAAKNTSN